MWYNKIVKRLAILTITSLIAIGTVGSVAAYAEENQTIYPQDGEFIKPLVFSSLVDYAAYGDKFAFAENSEDGSHISFYENGELSVYDYDKKINRIDCSDGVFYCSDEGGSVYVLPEMSDSDYIFGVADADITTDSYIYYFDDNGALTVINKSTKVSETLEGYYCLKQYDGVVYAVCDNALYSFSGEIPEPVSPEYTDFSSTETILTGQTAEALKNYALTFVTVNSGAYMTEIDLTSTDGEYFSVKNTIAAQEDTTALLLCYTGNAAVVAVGDVSYITLASSVTEAQINCYAPSEFNYATVTGNKIYASPYVITGTAALSDAVGMIVSVRNKLTLENVLGSIYYEVEYSENGEIKVGYIADGFLTEYIIEDNKEPTEIPDPEYSEENNIRNVLLILAVIILVLIALGYLTYVGTSGKNKKGGKDKKADGETEQ